LWSQHSVPSQWSPIRVSLQTTHQKSRQPGTQYMSSVKGSLLVEKDQRMIWKNKGNSLLFSATLINSL
jgi:hypothetical protein